MTAETRIDREALRALHAARFADLPFECGKALEPGFPETGDWRDWSEIPSTPDQVRIERYIDRFDLGGKSILHIGTGNSRLAARFAERARLIVGTTVVPEEVRRGEALGLANYRVLLHNKYRGRDVLEAEQFDFIVDNNPSSFCCCMSHFARMLEFYADAVGERGQFVTDRVGLAWTTKGADPRWGFSAEDLAAVARLAGLGTFPVGQQTLVLSRGRPVRPTIASRAQRLFRRARRALERLFGS